MADENGPIWETWQADRLWTSYGGRACDKPAHLYCIDDNLLLDEEK